ncbi:MAG: hypothetical protein ACRCWJ_17395 [Casimicrobium sp.]
MDQQQESAIAQTLFDVAFACINCGRIREGREILRGLSSAYGMAEPLLIDARVESLLKRDPSMGVNYIMQRVVKRFGLAEQVRVSLITMLCSMSEFEQALAHCEALVDSVHEHIRDFAKMVAEEIRSLLAVTDEQAQRFAAQ